MTFEARDSAAKVVPARFMAKGSSGSGRNTRSGRSSGRTTSKQCFRKISIFSLSKNSLERNVL